MDKKMGADHFLNVKMLEEDISYRFRDEKLLQRALTRRSFAIENDLTDKEQMDALATLGDAVIDLIILSRMIEKGGYDKGVISTEKMDIVNMSRLRRHAEDLHLERYVRWGKGETSNHVWTSGRVLAECLESLVGAMYIDAGIDPVKDFLVKINLPSEDFWNDREEKNQG